MQLILNVGWNSILDHFTEGPLVLADAILVLGKTNEIVDCFIIIRERYGYDCIFFVIFGRVKARNVGQLL